MLKQLKIKEIFFKNIFKALLIPTFLLVILVSVLYYLQIKTITDTQKQHLVKQFHSSMNKTIKDKTTEIEINFNHIETNLVGIQSAIENYYLNSPQKPNNQKFEFEKNERGFWYKPKKYSGSDVVFTPQATPDQQDFVDAYNLEKLDALIVPMVDRSDMIIATWMNQENYLVRYYPFFDMKNILEPDMDLKKFNFYYEVDPQNNPNMQNIWTTPYLDPAMKGWLISRVAPIRKEKQFLGVFGIDINIDNILNNVPKLYNTYTIRSFLTDKRGQILSMGDELKQYFDFINLDTYKNGKSLSNEVIQPNSYNILSSPTNELRSQLQEAFISKSYQKISHKNKSYFIYKSKVKNTNWFLFYMIDESELLNELNHIQEENLEHALYALIFFIFIFIMIFMNLKTNMKHTIMQISKPIEDISEATKDIGNLQLLNSEDIFEISILNTNFKTMAQEINQYKNELEKKVDERTEELHHKIQKIEELQSKLIEQNNHDHLTQLFNRRYGDKVLKRECEKALLESSVLTIAMLDIDYFKKINDTYGHQIGDSVLIHLSHIIKESMKFRDVPIRYGGEEFLLIFPNRNKDETHKIIELIQQKYHLEMLEKLHIEVGITLSAGIASFPSDSKNIEQLIKLSDDALYKSKNNGRNCITTI